MEVLKMGNGNNNEDEGGSSSVSVSVSVGDQIHRDHEENTNNINGCNSNYYWTNERHLSFLSSMEEAFVRNLMESHTHTHKPIINAATATATAAVAVDGGATLYYHRRCRRRQLLRRLETPRLDRFVPDISESTLDLKKSSPSVKVSDLLSKSGRRHRARLPTRQPYKISLDQVVPHAEDKAGDKDERERVRPQQLQETII